MGGPAQVQDQIRQDQVRKSDVSPVEQLHALIAADMAATDRLIHTRMTSGVALIPELARHLIDSGGKRLRPMLTLAAAQAGGYGGDHHVRLAAAVEFIHTATLLHDDVVDSSQLRLGRVAAHLIWGAPANMSSTARLSVSTINWKARENRKSPTSTDGLLPHIRLAETLPRRSALSSTTSSCSRVAV